MIWRIDGGRPGSGRRHDGRERPCRDDREGTNLSGARQSGFTLIEMIVVLVVLGLTLGLVLGRGPMHSSALDARMAAREVAQALRLARARAIALNRPIAVSLDIAARAVRIDGAQYQALPRAVGVTATSFAGAAIAGRVLAIRFAPDGSSSGVRIALGEGGFVRQVVVDWLTGRVSVDDPG
jgi:general secretion pathway protein H